ncbi:NAD(P)H-dependent oxidoreductase subunit E [Alteraurantiacibacter aquimixticola]|uniref:NADH-quinone oxidoreductase subunit E n=1 Tax=Alteraurantiacibacter aquimixticola TaxID=2489173 RepID=A0A4T3F257_9SPHN|nr:NAD(P)H-dependent oxidoreductase subunit E [Alteraurantiacibacter aquimixticola]TIX49495.1 NADH-quinone oxidoreductase subunit E [Alteraurantiacibacter aquimixticola]
MSTKEQKIGEIIAEHQGREGPLLPILHDVQEEFGCVDVEAEAIIAKALNLSRADVHGVVSFYHDYSPEADPRPVVQVCRAEACKARGVEKIIEQAKAAAGERVKISTVYCLGLCSAGPAARTGDDLHIRLDEQSIAKLVDNA